MSNQQKQKDFFVENHGSIWMFTPMTLAARQWTAEYVQIESWAWMGGSFSVDQHCVESLLDGITNADLTLENNFQN